MDGEVIIVAVDASKEITDYALEWAVRNVVKAMDSLILLAVLSSRGRPPANANRTYQSRVHQYLSCMLKKWGLGQNEQSSSEQKGIANGAEKEVSNRINNVCVQMMRQLCSVHNIMQVHTEVKVVADAQMGSVAAKAGELGAAWVILDRRLKKEGDSCLKQLECNIILIDHAIPKILRAVNPPTVKKFNMDGVQRDPTVADMLGVLPIYNPDNNSSGTTRSSLGIDSPSSDADVSFSLSSTDKDQSHKPSPSMSKNKPSDDNFLHLNSQYFDQEEEAQATFRSNPTSYSKSQQLHKVSKFEIDESPRKSSASSFGRETKSYRRTPPSSSKSQPLHQMSKFEIDESPHKSSASTLDGETKSNRRTPPSYSKSQPLHQMTNFEFDEPPRKSSDSPLEGKTKSYQRITPSYSKSQPLHQVSKFEIDESPRKSSASPLESQAKGYHRGHLKTISDMNTGGSIKATQTAPITFRRSTDSRSWQKPGSPNESKQLMYRRNSITGNRSEATASPNAATIERTSSIRKAMSLSVKKPPTPPPLCSVCKHSAPIFGKAVRKFSYKEIEQATDGFSIENFLAEGGFGPVYRGVLPDGQVVAVKQHRMLSAQGASEFCSEVEVLSCAQHRNLVMLVGYCIETEWLLVYEFACNGSLDKHLYGSDTNEGVAWHNRMKVALGAARGLRYLHEDCRVGCIVHRDFRPNNILLTHDFEPMVGDFGLARWQADGQSAQETRVIGSFGYLAPEYTQTGLITEKTDVYAFGVVLLELLSGFKATELSRNTGLQFLPEWGRPVLEREICREFLDPRLENNYVEKEVDCMMYAASLCISPHPDQRPRMSKVLKILEGDMPSEMAYQYLLQSLNSPKQKMSGYPEDRPLNQTQDFSPSHLMQSMHHMNLCPSWQSAHANDDKHATFKQMKPSDKVANGGGWSLNQPDQFLVNEEYQAYLQGSLTKYIQSLNPK